jgi:hypothetical protein
MKKQHTPVKKQHTAMNIWPVLVELARTRSTIVYGDLDKRIHHGTGQLGYQLGVVHWYCDRHGLPFLNMLVVGKRTNLPSGGGPRWDKLTASAYADRQRKVFKKRWATQTVRFMTETLAKLP